MRHVLTIILMVLVMVGCSSENPLCTSSFCVEGEIYPRSELADGQPYDTWEVDESGLLGVLGGATPVETQPQTPVSDPVVSITPLAIVVADVIVSRGNSKYVGQTLTVKESVHFNFVVRRNQGGISLLTGSENIFFYITDFENPNNLRGYTEGETYTFKVFIREVLPAPTQPNILYIYSHIVE